LPYGANGLWYEIQSKIRRKLIFSKWKEGLGGNIELIVSSAACNQISRVFTAADIPILKVMD
jgi:long-chain acyl-CoA synthetase